VALTEVVQDVLRGWPVVDNGIAAGPPPMEDGSVLVGALAADPRVGSDVWRGEEEAAEVVRWTVDEADADGRLRGGVAAVLAECMLVASSATRPTPAARAFTSVTQPHRSRLYLDM
jgi:hypothetical protein